MSTKRFIVGLFIMLCVLFGLIVGIIWVYNFLHNPSQTIANKTVVIVWALVLLVGVVMILNQWFTFTIMEDVEKANPSFRGIFFFIFLGFAVLFTILYFLGYLE